MPSAYAERAVSLFAAGVQDAYRKFARRGVETSVVIDGKTVVGVPRRENGRYVVSEKGR